MIVDDADTVATHRVMMFRDMGMLAAKDEATLHAETCRYLREAVPRGEYVGWLAEPGAEPGLKHDVSHPTDAVDRPVVAGGGIQLRRILPRVHDGEIILGPEALILNVYTEREWRRRGIAEVLVRHMVAWARARGIRRITLHASLEGRAIYERIGFTPTNEMQWRLPA